MPSDLSLPKKGANNMSEIYGWTGKILRADLSSGEISTVDTMQYVPDFIGGLGIASRIAWEEKFLPRLAELVRQDK